MNKIITLIAFLLLTSLGSKAQVTTILPLSSYEYPNGAYLKDLNNELPFYEGNWEGICNNKKYTFRFKVFYQYLTNYNNGYYHYSDILVADFKVIDLITGTTLYDNISASNYNDFKIYLTTLKSGGSFSYLDSQNCFLSAEFELFKVPGTTNQLKFNQLSLRSFLPSDDCPYQNIQDIPMFLPTGDFILTKI